jgi:hypothetical protein
VVDLIDADEKLRWARHHLDVLRPHIESFEKRDSHRISVETDHDAGEYVFYVHDLETPDPDWGLIVGDCIHNARTALDYVVVRLWADVTRTTPRGGTLAFPIRSPRFQPEDSDADIKRAYAAARDTFKKFAAQVAKEPEFSGYLTTIEQLQPFNSPNQSIWGISNRGTVRHPMLPLALDLISRLDDIDKHRVPHATWVTVTARDALLIEGFAPDAFVLESRDRTTNPLKNGAEVARCRFQTPLPSKWQPDEVDMKRCFPLEVAFGEPAPLQRVLEVLPVCLWGVESVMAIFRPVFDEGAPPLPITAIPEPRLRDLR